MELSGGMVSGFHFKISISVVKNLKVSLEVEENVTIFECDRCNKTNHKKTLLNNFSRRAF